VKLDLLADAIRDAFEHPTLKQKEAYGRFAHTLAAAAVIGAASVLFSETRWTVGDALRVVGLLLSGLVCFALGATLCKGE
jgi:hypothetical protein